MSILEKTVERQVCAYAEKRGWIALKFEPDASRGWPDRIFIGPKGDHFFIEFKAPGKKLRKLQVHRLQTLRDLNHRVFVIDDVIRGREVVDFHTT